MWSLQILDEVEQVIYMYVIIQGHLMDESECLFMGLVKGTDLYSLKCPLG